MILSNVEKSGDREGVRTRYGSVLYWAGPARCMTTRGSEVTSRGGICMILLKWMNGSR